EGDAKVAFAQVLPVEPAERFRLAELDETRRAPDAQDVNEVGERVVFAGAEIGRRLQHRRHPAREPAALGLADAGAVARDGAGRAPAGMGLGPSKAVGEELLFATLPLPAPAGTGTVTAAHGSKTLATYPHLDHPQERHATQPPCPTSRELHSGQVSMGR